MLRLVIRSASKADKLQLFKQTEERQIQEIEASLNDWQKQRIHLVAQAIDEMSPTEYNYLWEAYRQKNEAMLGIDPALFADFYPKLPQSEEWPPLSAEHMEFFQSMGSKGGFPGGFIQMVLDGNVIGMSSSSGDTADTAKEEVQEKTNFDVLITGFAPENKIKLIKEVKNALNIGLKDAKETVEKITPEEPLVLAKAAPKDRAEELSSKFGVVGATIELK